MIVRCTANSGLALPANYLDPRVGYTSEMEFPLTIARKYVVIAIALRQNQVWYYISDDDDLYYPTATPAPLFEVSDRRLSKYWRYAFTPEHEDHLALFAFQEWVVDDYFYDRLTDGKEPEVSIYQKLKTMMTSEAQIA
ncbi:MAG TPA: hypothetical protein VEW46_16830 [Pyrinomonadaceae bacterium]|nr:hypothetical protein [Pyrinomonadaceae bacterium]